MLTLAVTGSSTSGRNLRLSSKVDWAADEASHNIRHAIGGTPQDEHYGAMFAKNYGLTLRDARFIIAANDQREGRVMRQLLHL